MGRSEDGASPAAQCLDGVRLFHEPELGSEGIKASGNLVTRIAEALDTSVRARGIRQGPMNPADTGKAHGTDLFGTQRDDEVHVCGIDRVDRLRYMRRDVDAGLAQGLDRQRIDV